MTMNINLNLLARKFIPNCVETELGCVHWIGDSETVKIGKREYHPAVLSMAIYESRVPLDVSKIVHFCGDENCIHSKHMICPDGGTDSILALYSSRAVRVTNAQVQKIRENWNEYGYKEHGWASEIARIYCISEKTVESILNHDTHREVMPRCRSPQWKENEYGADGDKTKKLTDFQIEEIDVRWKKSLQTTKDIRALAKEYNITYSYMKKIVNGEARTVVVRV